MLAVAAVIAAVTSVVVMGLSLLLGDRQRRRREEQARRQDLNARYLNPLRLHLVENYYRLRVVDTVQAAEASLPLSAYGGSAVHHIRSVKLLRLLHAVYYRS